MSDGQGSSSQRLPDEESIAASTCAVIVTYFPDPGVPERARRIASQVGAVIVVDNGSGADHEGTLGGLSPIPNLTVIRNDTNLGVAAALNQGVGWAKQHGYGWVLLFDQDTTPVDTMVAELGRIHRDLRQESSKILLGCNFLEVNSGATWLTASDFPNQRWTDVAAVPTSGTFIPLSTFDDLGPFWSDLFVDCIDLEYGLRAQSRGYRVAMTVQPLMLHSVGAQTKRRLLGRTVWPTNHPPLRRYFLARNMVLLIREYGPRDPRWGLSAILTLGWTLALILRFEDEKLAKVAFAARGVVAGIRGKTGNLT